jgi:rhomboid protease GluP
METILRTVSNEALAHEWELVLLSQGLSPELHYTTDGIVLSVPQHQAERAFAGLAAYEKENSRKAHPPQMPNKVLNLPAGVIAGSLLVGFFAVTMLWSTEPWLERGSASAGKIVTGEFWRTMTSLTLHGDIAHALSNGFAMVVFFGAVSGQLGAGLAGALVLATGAVGNLANAYLQGSPHDAVGASTAIFAAVGMLGSLAMMRRWHEKENRRRAWIAIAASLALLGMLGSSGARVDVVAHLLGFLAGAVVGVAAVLFLPARPTAFVQWFCGGATIASVIYCWVLALS